MDATDSFQVEMLDGRHLRTLDQFTGSLSARVYSVLKDAILTLVYLPGEIIRRGEICDMLSVSRSPVSEALAILAGEGLVIVVPKAGTFVSRFAMDEMRQGAFLREALELAAVERVANTITHAEVLLLRRNLLEQQEMADALDFAGFHQKDAEFHALILSFTGYKRLARLAETAWVQVNRARHLYLPATGRIHETMREHQRIVDAIAAHDVAAARQATRHHLGQLIKYLEPLEKQRPDLFVPL